MKIKFEILGKPMGKGRPRLGRYGVHTPARTANYETLVKWTFLNEFENFKPFEGSLIATITATFTIPKSYTEKQKRNIYMNPYYPHKPDCDNIAKIILDSLNGIAYLDDKQVVSLIVLKIYGKEEKISVELEEI